MSDSNLFSSIKPKRFSVEGLLEIYGPFPRNPQQSIVLCHGTFDLVHPGHLRQLSFAKTLGAILVVSITSDRWITKQGVKPYITEEIRAINVEALELVDAVCITDAETPLDLIEKLKPDTFVKGADYVHGQNPKTQEELDHVESYGGQMIFSPGDFVMSSSEELERRDFNIGPQKLRLLLDQEKVNLEDFHLVVSRFENTPVLLIGDTIVDRVTFAKMIGASGKTPTLSARKTGSSDFIGGAAIVALHLASAGAKVKFLSVLGADDEGKFVESELRKSGVNFKFITESGRPTTLKESFDVDGYRLLKLDRVSNATIQHSTKRLLLEEISSFKDGLVIFSDFRHGIFDAKSAREFVSALNPGVTSVADSQVASRWGNILDFRGVDLMAPNEKEARFSLGDQDSSLRPLGEALFAESKAKLVVLKVGADGAIGYRRRLEGTDPRHFFVVDSMTNNAVDAIGAGDALLAYSSLALHARANPVVATSIGVAAASLACERNGNTPVRPVDVLKRIRQKVDGF